MDQETAKQLAGYALSAALPIISYGIFYELGYPFNKSMINLLDNHIAELRLYLQNMNNPLAERVYRISVEGIKTFYKKTKITFLPAKGFFDGIKKRRELSNLLEQV